MDHDELVIRVRYLEKVVNNLIPNKSTMSTKSSKKAGDQGGDQKSPPTSPKAPKATSATGWELVYTSCDVKSPVTGKLVKVTRDTLLADPVLLDHMLTKHADCFKAVATVAASTDAEADAGDDTGDQSGE